MRTVWVRWAACHRRSAAKEANIQDIACRRFRSSRSAAAAAAPQLIRSPTASQIRSRSAWVVAVIVVYQLNKAARRQQHRHQMQGRHGCQVPMLSRTRSSKLQATNSRPLSRDPSLKTPVLVLDPIRPATQNAAPVAIWAALPRSRPTSFQFICCCLSALQKLMLNNAFYSWLT